MIVAFSPYHLTDMPSTYARIPSIHQKSLSNSPARYHIPPLSHHVRAPL